MAPSLRGTRGSPGESPPAVRPDHGFRKDRTLAFIIVGAASDVRKCVRTSGSVMTSGAGGICSQRRSWSGCTLYEMVAAFRAGIGSGIRARPAGRGHFRSSYRPGTRRQASVLRRTPAAVNEKSPGNRRGLPRAVSPAVTPGFPGVRWVRFADFRYDQFVVTARPIPPAPRTLPRPRPGVPAPGRIYFKNRRPPGR